MRRAPLAILLLALAATALPSGAAETVWTKSGSYLVGSPFADRVRDACTSPVGATNGVDSSCADLPAGLGGLTYSIVDSDRTNTASARVCFYAGQALLQCGTGGIVPLQATRFAVTSLTGADVKWTFTVTR